MAPRRSMNRLSPAHQNTRPRHSEVINLHFKFFLLLRQKRFLLYLTCFGVHCCLPRTAVMCLIRWCFWTQQAWWVDHVICHASYVLHHQVVAGGESIKAPSSLLMVSAPFFLISNASFIHRLYLWVSDAIIAEFSQSIMWISRLQWSKKFCFAFSFSPRVSWVAVCFSQHHQQGWRSFYAHTHLGLSPLATTWRWRM